MNKKPGVAGGKKVHLIGGDKMEPQQIIPAIIAQLKPTLDLILGNVTALEGRMAVVEEVKQLFPSQIKVDVTVKHEKPQDISEGVLDMIVERLKKHGKVAITSVKK